MKIVFQDQLSSRVIFSSSRKRFNFLKTKLPKLNPHNCNDLAFCFLCLHSIYSRFDLSLPTTFAQANELKQGHTELRFNSEQAILSTDIIFVCEVGKVFEHLFADVKNEALNLSVIFPD